MGSTKDGDHPVGVRLLAMAYYGISSTVVMFFTKAVLTTWKFEHPLLLALLQQGVTLPATFLIARPPITSELLVDKAPLAAANVINVVAGLVGTGDISMPMFVALRRFTMVCTLVLEYALYRKTRDSTTKLSVALMLGGALAAAVTDLSFNLQGYIAIALNDFFSSLYMILMKYKAEGLSRTGLMCYNSMIATPFLLAACLWTGDLRNAWHFEHLSDPRFLATLFFATVMGLAVTHSTFVCTQITDPIMTSVVGVAKNVVTTIAGAVVFPDYVPSGMNALALTASTGGAAWYAIHTALPKGPPGGKAPKAQGGGGRAQAEDTGRDLEMQRLIGEEREPQERKNRP